jgi:hypothetical protein
LASRNITITNTEELRDKRLQELRLYLKNQQYPEEIVEHGIQKALEKGPIDAVLREQVHVTSNQNNIIPFVTTYNPRDYNIFHLMKQIEFNLNSSERMKNVLQKKKIINSKGQPKNLKRFLSSSKLDFHESSPSVKKCTDKRCMTCPSLIKGTSFTFKNGRTFTVMQDILCKTKNLVYAIIYSNCGEFYVGETKTELRTRMIVHRQQTRHQDLTTIRANEHFHRCSGGHFKIFPLYKVNTEGDFLRRKEILLINILKPTLNDKWL